MDPIVGSALIFTGASLISSLLGNSAARDIEKKRQLAQSRNQAFESQRQGAEDQGINAQTAFGQLMETYRSALT